MPCTAKLVTKKRVRLPSFFSYQSIFVRIVIIVMLETGRLLSKSAHDHLHDLQPLIPTVFDDTCAMQ